MANTASSDTGQKSWESIKEEVMRDEKGLQKLKELGIYNLENVKFEDMPFLLYLLLKTIKNININFTEVGNGDFLGVLMYLAGLQYHLQLFMKDELSPTQFEDLIPRIVEGDIPFNRKEKSYKAYRIMIYYLLQHLERIKRETPSLAERLKVVNDIIKEIFIFFTSDLTTAIRVSSRFRKTLS